MAKQPNSSGSPKNKDDDSWGKLASDLLGIQFGGPDDDFDLPDEDAPPAKPVAAATPPVPLAVSDSKPAPVQQQAEPDLSFSEDDLSFPEDLEEEPTAKTRDVVEPVTTGQTAVHPRNENEPDIWDQLESWNWEEPVKSAPRSQNEPLPGRGGDRLGRRGASGPPRDRDAGRERSRGRSDDRPPRPTRESEAPAAEQAPRERPSRPAQRPARQPESTEQRPPRPGPSRSVASEKPDDGFAAGLDEEPTRRRAPSGSSRPNESTVAPAARKPAPPSSDTDEGFAVDLFAELARAADGGDTAEPGSSGESGSSEEDRPRRRRRRRRGGRGGRPGTLAGEIEQDDRPDSEEHTDGDPLAFASDDDSSDSDTEDDEEFATRSEGTEEGGEQRPRRRRRRRGRRRPDEQPTAGAAIGANKRSENEKEEEDDEDEVRDEPEASSERVEEEPLAPVNYEGIPTWEEAISYLIRTRNPEPRGRGNSGSRGRGGPPHRR